MNDYTKELELAFKSVWGIEYESIFRGNFSTDEIHYMAGYAFGLMGKEPESKNTRFHSLGRADGYGDFLLKQDDLTCNG